MKRKLGAPLLAIGAAILILVPTTFAVGEPGTTLYAQLTSNRFPSASAAADAKLHFLNSGQIRLDVTVAGLPARPWAARIYSQGSCTFVRNWVANRDVNGQFISVLSNSGEHQFLLFSGDVARIRAALARGHSLAFMVAGTHPTTGLSYRTCTAFRAAPFPPLTTTTATTTTTPTTTATTTTRTTVTSFSTGTILSTVTNTLPVTQTTFGTTPVTTATSLATSTVVSTGTATTITGITTITSLSTGFSTFTTGTTTFTTTVTLTTGVSTFTTAVTLTN